jgi:hypothetical protein
MRAHAKAVVVAVVPSLLVAAHAAVGFGVPFARQWSVGLEAGWLQHGVPLLACFAFTF